MDCHQSTKMKPSPALLLQLEAAAEADHAQHEGLVHSSLAAALQAAHAWQASTLQRQGSGTGACLCSNFLLIADCVMEQDAHLISQQERKLLQTFKASPLPVQVAVCPQHNLSRSSLLCRSVVRCNRNKGPPSPSLTKAVQLNWNTA